MSAALRKRPDTLSIILALAIAIAVTMHAAIGYATLRRPFDSDWHAWANTLYALIARSFAQQGILALHGVQIANNPPLGTQPDVYIHWPPLFSMTLSRLFLLFGESEAVARGFALVISFACVVAVGFLVRGCCGTRVALGAAFGFLILPAFFDFTRLVQGTMLAILFEMLALLCFIKGTGEGAPKNYGIIGAIALLLGVFSSWEPLLLPPTLLVISWFQRDQRKLRLAIVYLAVGVIAFAAVMSLYLLAAPNMALDLWHTMLFRTGLTYTGPVAASLPLHAIFNLLYYTRAPSLADTAAVYVHFCRTLLGIGPFVMLVFALFKMTIQKTWAPQTTTLVAGLFGPWMLWFLFMHNQVVDNNFQMLLAVPPVAVCVGISFAAMHDAIRDHLPGGALPVRVAATVVLVAYLLSPLTRAVGDWWTPPPPSGWVEYAREVEQDTPPSSVVLITSPSTLPAYYSRRHMLRTRDDASVKLTLSKIDAVFPGAPVFIALIPKDLYDWRESACQFKVVGESSYLILLYVGDAGDGRMARAAELLPGVGSNEQRTYSNPTASRARAGAEWP
jgi:4-amino-4-deoxy-L-arabinose transferase-like glycosyltransferase